MKGSTIAGRWGRAGGRRKRRGLAAGLLLVAAAPLGAHDQVPGPPQQRPVLLRGGDLHTVSNGVLAGTDLLFEAGRIVRIGREISPPPDAAVVDVTGQRIYPGIIAAQSTLGLIEIGAVRATNDRSETGGITPEVAAHVAFNPDSELIPTVRSHGITTVQVAPQGGLLRGGSFITHLDGWTKEDSAVRWIDALHVDWPAVTLGRGWWAEEDTEERRERLEQSQRRLRGAFDQALAYDRVRDADDAADVDLRWEAMRPLFGEGLPLHVLADDAREIVEAVEFARKLELDLVIVGGREAWRAIDVLRDHDVAIVLRTTSALPLRDDDDYDVVFRLPALLGEAGVRFCLTHITWGGWDVRNLPFHAGQAVAHGLSADQALRSITLSAAEILGVDAELGSLDVGKEATLFVSDGDVLDPLTQRVTRMWIRGREVDLDDRQQKLYRKYRHKPGATAAR